jgi:hypothetical protein
MTDTEKEELKVNLEDIIRKELDEYPMIHEYSLVIARCCAVHFEDPGDCDCYIAGELVPTLAEAIVNKLQTKIEEAEKRGMQKGYMIVKEHVLDQVHQSTVDKNSLISLLDTLYDNQESNLADNN